VGAVVWATGWVPYDAKKMDRLGFGKHPNIITNMMMERLAAPNGPTQGQITRPSDGKAPASIAFVQCAGSRDENYLPYCSYICCMASLKQTTYIREQYPEAKIYIFYIDLRAPGYRYEKFYDRIKQDPNVVFIKGKVAEVNEDSATGNITVVAENAVTGEKIQQTVEMVVLATGMQPTAAVQKLPAAVKTTAGRVHPERLFRRRHVRGRLRQQACGCRFFQSECDRNGPQGDSNPGETVGGRP
jgi:quinone-modifying oxidoreductase, subunit QmoA